MREKKDVLAMCALQFAAQVEQKEIDNSNDQHEVEERLKSLNQLLLDHLA